MQGVSQKANEATSTIERSVKSLVPAEQEHIVDEGKAILKRYLNLPISFSLEYDITKARNIIQNLKDFPAWIDGKLVSSQIKQADAVVFLTTARAGIFMTGQFGTGLVVARRADGNWSAPSAIGFIGTGLGLQAGADLTDYVIILKRQAVDAFIGDKQLVLGADAGLSIGIGRHGAADLHIGKKSGLALGWAASKGAFVGAAAQVGLIKTRNGANKKFYGREVDPAELLTSKIERPRAARPLYDALLSL